MMKLSQRVTRKQQVQRQDTGKEENPAAMVGDGQGSSSLNGELLIHN